MNTRTNLLDKQCCLRLPISCILKSVDIFIFLDILENLIDSKCMNVCDETIPTSSTLPVNNALNNDDSSFAKMSDLTNTPMSEGTYTIQCCLNIYLFVPTLAYFKYILHNR